MQTTYPPIHSRKQFKLQNFSVDKTGEVVPVHIMTSYRNEEVQLHSFVISALYGMRRQLHALAVLTLREKNSKPTEQQAG